MKSDKFTYKTDLNFGVEDSNWLKYSVQTYYEKKSVYEQCLRELKAFENKSYEDSFVTLETLTMESYYGKDKQGFGSLSDYYKDLSEKIDSYEIEGWYVVVVEEEVDLNADPYSDYRDLATSHIIKGKHKEYEPKLHSEEYQILYKQVEESYAVMKEWEKSVQEEMKKLVK